MCPIRWFSRSREKIRWGKQNQGEGSEDSYVSAISILPFRAGIHWSDPADGLGIFSDDGEC